MGMETYQYIIILAILLIIALAIVKMNAERASKFYHIITLFSRRTLVSIEQLFCHHHRIPVQTEKTSYVVIL